MTIYELCNVVVNIIELCIFVYSIRLIYNLLFKFTDRMSRNDFQQETNPSVDKQYKKESEPARLKESEPARVAELSPEEISPMLKKPPRPSGGFGSHVGGSDR